MSASQVLVTLKYEDRPAEEFHAEPGVSLMQATTAAGFEGILAECGGNLSCATCHVIIESAGCELDPVSDDEDEMLDCTATERDDRSRLSCQFELTEESSPLVVRIPSRQK